MINSATLVCFALMTLNLDEPKLTVKKSCIPYPYKLLLYWAILEY